ncbi:MAG: endonuclease III, partial [Bacteroidia bacterium]|nr:endonuclease III [Bacteroidia bacterium]
MRKAERYRKIVGWFSENMPVAETELHYETPFQLLVAV